MAKVTDRLAKYSWITTSVSTVHRRVLFIHYLVDERHVLGDPVTAGISGMGSMLGHRRRQVQAGVALLSV
jgi:hypothetical protein